MPKTMPDHWHSLCNSKLHAINQTGYPYIKELLYKDIQI